MKNNVVKNTTWLFAFQIAKILFPFITLPYLTRVLTTDSYGVVTYVKTVMTYMQIFVDFGFVLSGTKEIVKTLKNKNKESVETIIGDTMIARIVLGIIGYVIVIIMSLSIPIMRENIIFSILTYTVVFESIFLMDFVFRGYEKMNVIAIRFVIMKIISTIFTFVLIKSDSNLLMIPILDMFSSFVAIMLVQYETNKLDLRFRVSNIHNIICKLKDSLVYFISNVASTSFNAFSTIIIGIYLSKTDIAYWGLCMQIIGTIQALYSPITDGIYPEMIKNKNISILIKYLKVFMPIVVIGCIVAYVFAPFGFSVLGGEEYLPCVDVFRLLIPCLFFGFIAMLFGWPVLGAVNKEKQATITTIASILFNIILTVLLIISNKFTLVSIAIIRSLTEIVLFLFRFTLYLKYKNEFRVEEI